MQTQLLAKYPAERLRVYAVWLPMLGGDARDKWDGTTMPDPRVIQFWDKKAQVGEWFAKQVHGYEGVVWDIYYLYGPDAVWEAGPQPLINTGRTIYAERDVLKTELLTLLNE